MNTRLFTSRKSWLQLLIAGCISLCTSITYAQVSGTKVIGIDYPDLATAISTLNTSGISGAVTINVPAGYSETAPAGGYLLGSTVLNASTSASNTLTIQKSGAGADPLLTAATGTSTTTDGIFIIRGTDYVTIDGIDLAESSSNITATTRMEWGYALVKLQNTAPFDGCQNVTIQNCTVTLNRANTTTVGIYANDHIATATTILTITATGDAMNNCKFYSNTIQNTMNGILLKGFAAPSPYTLYDQNNDVGGSSSSTANTIQNYGGSVTAYGINLQNQNNANVSYNTINNTAGTGTPSTSILYGIYTQTGTNVTLTATSNNIRLTQGVTTSALYGINTSCSGTGTVNINDNTITANGGGSGSMYMIYFGGSNANTNTNNNTFSNINVATTGSLYLVYHNTSSGTQNINCNNNITAGTSTPYINKTGAGGTIAGYYNNSSVTSGVVNFNNNNFSNFNLAGSPTFYGLFENDGGTGQNKFARNNTISNITSTGGSLYGLWMGFSASETFADNEVFSINAGTGAAYGIYVNTSSSLDTVINNSIHDLSSSGGNIYGIYIAGGTTVIVTLDTVYNSFTTATAGACYGIYQSGGTNMNIFRNKIYDITSTGTSGSVNGMYLNSGTVTAYNNLIGNITTPAYNGAGGTQLVGIYLGSGTAYNIYYNSVYLNTTSIGAAFGDCAIYSNSTTPPVTLRNNIFVNLSTAKGAGLVTGYRRNGTSLTSYQNTSNNNLFYVGTPGPSNVVFYDGTTAYSSLPLFQFLVAPRDANSVTENPTFVSTSGSSLSFLHISTSVATQIESGASNIAGITTDADGNIRAGNSGYTGSGSSPDIGAEEGNYILTDLTSPVITYAPLSSGCSTGDRTFAVTITDASGVPTSGTLMPRVYFEKGSGPWFSSAGSLASGTAKNGVWSFTISATTLGGLSVGDVISYFIIAQDVSSTPNISANPAPGVTASDVNTITSYPTPPNTYTIIPVLSGTYAVGVGKAYTTITDAVTAYNSSCISGNVVFQLTDATYPGETFPITINNNGSSGAANTLTIAPAPGVTTTISGSATALFILNGAKYVTIDGSNSSVANSVCPAVSASRDLTIHNTSTSTSSAVIWLQTTSGGDSATHDVVRNCNIEGSGSSSTLFAVGSGGTAISYTSKGTNNNSNRIENNYITATQTGIYTMGASAANKNTGTVINQNHMDAASPDNLRNNGIFTGFEDGILISGNSLANITNAVSNDILGINLGFNNNATSATVTTGNDVTNATVTNNKLDNIKQTNTYTCLGIAVAGVTTGTNTIANNMISGVLSNGTSGDFSSGIFIGGASGGTTRIYYNAIEMSGTLTGSTYSSFAMSVSGTNPILDIKNNIFVNSASTGSSLIYAIGLAYSTYSNLSSDHNDFYSVGTNMGTIGSLAGTGTNQAAIANWRTTTGQDLNSKQVYPAFTSPSDLHLTTTTPNIPLMDVGVPVSITSDYDCGPRSSTTPDLGINEFNIPLCSSVTAGTATPTTAAFCATGSTVINLIGSTAGIGINYQWQSSIDSSSWSVIPGATSNSYTTPTITVTTYYRAVLNCIYSGLSDSSTTKVIINPLPVIVVTPDGGAICTSDTGIGMTASGAIGYTWAPGGGLSTTAGATVTANPTTTTTYTITGTDANGCVNTHASTVNVTTAPGAVIITPPVANLCPGSPAIQLVASGAAIASSGPDSVLSGTMSLTVPDNTPAGITSALSVAGIPVGANITSVKVRFNITMTFDGDLTIGLTAPNGKTLNLVNRRGGSGDNFVNTVVSSAGGLTFVSSAAPFTNTYSADAVLGVGPTSLLSNTNIWGDLYSVPSGAWTLSARDNASGDVAKITSWILTIDYTYSPTLSWSPVGGLFNDAAATIPYTGTDTTSVYTLPDTTTTYLATLRLGACTTTTPVPVNIVPFADADTIVGPSSVCLGSTVPFTDPVSGGVWMVTNPNATITSGGAVTGVTIGIDTVMYIVTNFCSIDTAIKVIKIDVFPVVSPISGPSAVCEGVSISLADPAPFGVWSVSNTSASVNSTGTVTGVAAGIDTISYTVANGCGTVLSTHIVIVNPQPHAGTISGPSSVCVANTILLIDTASGGVWSSSNSNASVTSGGIVSGIAAGTATISYVVTNSCNTDIATYPIIVGPLPPPSTISGPATVCAGSTITLSESMGGGIWSVSNTNATVSSTGDVTGVTAGTSIISYELFNSCGSTYATYAVTVNAAPDAGVITGISTVCVGSSISLTDASTGGVWSSSDPFVASVSPGGVVTGAGAGTALISYTVTNSCGTATTSKLINVNPLPVAFSVTGGGAYCAGGSGLDVALSGSVSGVKYQLYNGPTPVGGPLTGTGGVIDFGLQTAAGTYTVIATNTTTGCSNTMTGSAVIGINPTTPPSVSISVSSDPICTGSSATFTAVAVNGGVSPSYVWKVNGVVTSSGVSYTYVPASGDVVSVTITSSPCAVPDTASSSVTVKVAGFSTPSVSISADPGSEVCEGATVTLTAVPVFGGVKPFIRWNKNGVNVATGPTYSYVPANGDIVYCVMGSTYPCRLVDSVASSAIVIRTIPVVTPTINIVATPGTSISFGQTVTLKAVVAKAGSAPAYQWYINKTPIAGATLSTFTRSDFSNNDTVIAVVTSSSVCHETASKYVVIKVGNTGVNNANATGADINVIPNPNKGEFTIKGTLGITNDQEVSLEITDMLGQVVYKNKVLVKNGNIEERVSLDNTLANGMYLLNVRADATLRVFHIVVER
ncbi:MAG: hypothetical protein JWQ38_1499 [Flavipsychrobacter sp.]|nr:hypothetical protein [Flavipsychrobacter sp.]